MDCNSQLEKITRRKLRDLKRKRSGRCRSFSITRFRLERSLHLRRLMAQLRSPKKPKDDCCQPLPNSAPLRIPMKRASMALFRPFKVVTHVVSMQETTVFERFKQLSVS
ncbi:hypothetical protein L596_008683 [Steinernema carpocapsae]|uniref:Uncharacterized protein n=1 Tax=Steinernema carpocapsae TaxID=34508 RepID=A0A4U5PEC2_STECR|nr:hypothetical protein L596_008683 [Steinernema carpocapsae]